MPGNGIVFTCGIEAFQDYSYLITVLKSYGIQCVIDVRNKAEIETTPRAGKTALRELFYLSNLHYRDYTDGFSLDVTDRRFLCSKGYVDLEKYRHSLAFTTCSKKLSSGIERDYRSCLLGYQNDFRECHRFLLGFYLLDDGINLHHLCGGEPPVITQAEAEQARVEEEFPSIDQLALFEMPVTTYSEKRSKTLELISKSFGQKWLDDGGKIRGS